jgi:hypothetical protein
MSSPAVGKLARWEEGPLSTALLHADQKLAIPLGVVTPEGQRIGPFQNALDMYDRSENRIQPAAPSLQYAQNLAAQNNDAPTLASTLGIKTGLSGVKRAQ